MFKKRLIGYLIQKSFLIIFHERWRNHNYYILLYESGIEPLVAMKIVGHTDNQTTANIYTHVNEEMLKKASADLEGIFKKRAGKECDRTEQHHEERFPVLLFQPVCFKT